MLVINSNYTTWRDYAINQAAGLFGPLIEAALVESKFFGPKGTFGDRYVDHDGASIWIHTD